MKWRKSFLFHINAHFLLSDFLLYLRTLCMFSNKLCVVYPFFFVIIQLYFEYNMQFIREVAITFLYHILHISYSLHFADLT